MQQQLLIILLKGLVFLKAKKKKKQSSGLRTFFLSMCITLGVGCGIVFLFRNNLSGLAQSISNGFHDNRTSDSKQKTQETVLKQTPRADDVYLAGTLFVGDSRTNGLKATGEIDEGNIVASDGMSHSSAVTQRVIDRGSRLVTIPEAVSEIKPSRMVVNFGINGIAWLNEEQFISDYETLLTALEESSPDSVIIIESILPVSASKERSEPRMANSKIDRYNELLRELAQKRGHYYLNSASALKDADGNMATEYDSGDGLHFNSDGSKEILNQVLTHAVEDENR